MTRLTICLLLCLLLCRGISCYAADAQESEWAPAATCDGVPYQRVEELRSFYKLTPSAQPQHKGALASMSLGSMRLELGPGKRELRLGGLLLELCYPLQRDAAGQLLISREDWVSWVDPILRPTYINGRETVRRVVLDAGHGGHDAGVSAGSAREADITLQVAQRLKAELEKQGCAVTLTRSGDYFLSDQQRVDAANAAEGGIFISLHLNTGRSDFRGARVYALAPPAPGASPLPGHARSGSHAALAYALQSALVRVGGAGDAGCHRAHYSLLSSVTCPAVWVELGYATHEQEGPALASPPYQDALARALAQGISTFIRVSDPAARIPVQEAPPKVAVKSPPPTPQKTTPAAPKKTTTAAPKKSTASPAKRTPARRTTRRKGR